MCACVMHTLAAGDAVKLTAHFAEVADARDGPLKPGEIGRVLQVYHWRRGTSCDVRSCDGSVWWYKEEAIELARSRRMVQMPRLAQASGSKLVRHSTPSVAFSTDISDSMPGTAKFAVDLTGSRTGPTRWFDISAPGDSDDTASVADDAKSTSRRSSFSSSSDTSDSECDMPKISGPIIVDLMPWGAFGEDDEHGLGRRASNLEGDNRFELDLTDFASDRA